MLESAIDQAQIMNDPTWAAECIIVRLKLEAAGNVFGSLNHVRYETYRRGRDLGLTFDLLVSINLAFACVEIAHSPDERGEALNDLGAALAIHSERQGDALLLRKSADAYALAHLVHNRETAPLDWAGTQNNLGNVLSAMGDIAGDSALLWDAVKAYRSELLEFTRLDVPIKWAGTQNNLGAVLLQLGKANDDISLLHKSEEAYALAQSERSTEHEPMEWAGTQLNIAILNHAFHTIAADPARLNAAREHAVDARAVYAQAGASRYLQKCNNFIALLDDLKPNS